MDGFWQSVDDLVQNEGILVAFFGALIQTGGIFVHFLDMETKMGGCGVIFGILDQNIAKSLAFHEK